MGAMTILPETPQLTLFDQRGPCVQARLDLVSRARGQYINDLLSWDDSVNVRRLVEFFRNDASSGGCATHLFQRPRLQEDIE